MIEYVFQDPEDAAEVRRRLEEALFGVMLSSGNKLPMNPHSESILTATARQVLDQAQYEGLVPERIIPSLRVNHQSGRVNIVLWDSRVKLLDLWKQMTIADGVEVDELCYVYPQHALWIREWWEKIVRSNHVGYTTLQQELNDELERISQ